MHAFGFTVEAYPPSRNIYKRLLINAPDSFEGRYIGNAECADALDGSWIASRSYSREVSAIYNVCARGERLLPARNQKSQPITTYNILYQRSYNRTVGLAKRRIRRSCCNPLLVILNSVSNLRCGIGWLLCWRAVRRATAPKPHIVSTILSKR
jgi:hypothetical protein